MKILFLLRKSQGYGTYSPIVRSGLHNSARITAEQLEKYYKVRTKVKVVTDSNDIDREITEFKPRVCILEAIWILPEKLKQLTKLHPEVEFIIRVHSEIPFLANEGESINRISAISKVKRANIAFNSKHTYEAFSKLYSSGIMYLPNIYEDVRIDPIQTILGGFDFKFVPKGSFKPKRRVYNIACFGAIRPMKNQLQQAVAAIRFGDKHKVKVRFHVNATRLEQGGESVIKNIRALFKGRIHELVEHGWLCREDFLEVLSTMNLSMQMSFNESFNIVTADSVLVKVPVIVSPTIDWIPKQSQEASERIEDIVNKMEDILMFPKYHTVLNTLYLDDYNGKAIRAWRSL